MARPKKAVPNVVVKVPISPTLLAKMDLKLYSALSQRVPYGARTRYLTSLIEADLAKDAK